MAFLTLTHTQSRSSFDIDEKDIIKIYAKGSGAIIEHTNVEIGLRKAIEVDESAASAFAMAKNMVSTTIDGNTVYLNVDRVFTVEDVNSLASVRYDNGGETVETLNLDVSKATFLAGFPASFTEYRAMLTQSGTNAPVADDIDGGATDVPFIDTIGGVWSYFNVGRYRYTKAGAFADVTKVEYILGINNYNQGADIAAAIYKIDANTIELQVARLDAFLSPTTASLENGVLYNQPIVIRVYN